MNRNYSVRLSVCVCVCVNDNSKNKGSIHLKLEHIVVYENSSDAFNIGHCPSKFQSHGLFISSDLNNFTNCYRMLVL